MKKYIIFVIYTLGNILFCVKNLLKIIIWLDFERGTSPKIMFLRLKPTVFRNNINNCISVS